MELVREGYTKKKWMDEKKEPEILPLYYYIIYYY
jgi:hypothetical protein